ncbi:hypothetical protein [Flavobacterium aestuarii]|uniref:hypothetical protein n=1 Tax=Flavobacterium aestuarii TaxID=3149227 RepID=UPI0032B6202B
MEKSDKNMEDFIEKMMGNDALQSPSIDFTAKIMSQIQVAEERKNKIYTPLISSRVWFCIILSLIIIGVYASLYSGTESSLEIENDYSERILAFYSGFHLSKNVLYAVLIVPVMILVQVGLLKNYFDKRYQF